MATKITGTNTAAAPGVTGDDADTGLFYGTNEIGFSTGGTSRATLDSSGKFRLGSGNPTYNFEVQSTGFVETLIGSTNASGAGIILDGDSNGDGSGGDYAQIFHQNDGTLNFRARNASGGTDTIFLSGTTERLRITSAGLLGIGEASPTYQTEIKVSDTSAFSGSSHNTGQNQLRVNNAGASGVAGILLTAEPSSGSAGHASIRTIAPASGSADLIFSTRNSSTFAERLRIDSSGNVGIGTTSPVNSLHVNSGATNTAALFESTDTEVAIQLKDTTGSSVIKARNDFRFDNSTGELMRIDSSGSLLVGGTSATGSDKLEVFDSGNNQFRLTRPSVQNYQFGIVSGGHLYIAGSSNGELVRFESGGNVKIDDGNLVIGTSGHGIDFSANSHAGGMTSETLDSYEEGTWTPTDGSGQSISFSNTSGNCHYTKIGRTVIASFRATFPSTSNAHEAKIGGLPFTCMDTSTSIEAAAVSYHTDDQSTTMIVIENQAYIVILHCHNGVDARTNAECSGKDYRGTAIYQTA